LASEFPTSSFSALVKVFPIFIYARFLSAECYNDLSFGQKVIKAFKFGYIIALIFLVLQLVWGLKVTFYNTVGNNTVMAESNLIRYPGYFFDSQLNGQYLAMVSFIFLYTIKKGYKNNIVNYSVFASAILAIFLAGSRSAFGGFCIGLIVVFVLARNEYRIVLTILLLAGSSFYMVFSPANGVLNRSNTIDEDYQFRQGIWEDAFEIATNHPFTGIGVGNYKEHTKKYYQDQYFLIDDEIVHFEHPENGYLKILVEFGFLGFAVFAFLILSPLVGVLQHISKGVQDDNISFLIAGIVSWLVAFNTVYSFWDYRILICVTTLLVLLITYPVRERNYFMKHIS
jgi:O-antigen ligase